MKFLIRDLMWLTVVVALAVAWWVEHRQLSDERARVEGWKEYHRQEMQEARGEAYAYKHALSTMGYRVLSNSSASVSNHRKP